MCLFYGVCDLFDLEVSIMNVFSLKKFQKMYHKHTEHIESYDFRKTPKEVKEKLSEEDFRTVCGMIFFRDEERRLLLINEGVDGWNDILGLLIPLDLLPHTVLSDMYNYYNRSRKNVTSKNISTFNDDETTRRTILCLIPEIMWCHGDDAVKSRIWNLD